MRRLFMVALFASALVVSACNKQPGLPVDARCQVDADCESELCVMEPFSGATCKDPCGGNDSNCPAGQRCTGRAAGYVAYCELVVEE